MTKSKAYLFGGQIAHTLRDLAVGRVVGGVSGVSRNGASTDPPLLATTTTDHATGGIAAVTVEGSGEEYEEVYNRGPAAPAGAKVLIVWTAGKEVDLANGVPDEDAGGQWEFSGVRETSTVDPELPPGSVDLDCGCSKCPDGSPNHSCDDCGCFHKTLYTAMPLVTPTFGPREVWSELAAIRKLTYWQDCKSRSAEFNGPPCTTEYGEERRDTYRLIEDFAAETLELVRTGDNGCPLITLKWKRCGCPKRCNCPRQYEIASDGVNNLEMPEQCKVCVTPNWPRRPGTEPKPLTLCGPDDCVVSVSDVVGMQISGTNKGFPTAIGGGDQPVNQFSFDGTYRLDRDHVLNGVCCDLGEVCTHWGYEQGWTALPLFLMPDHGADVYGYEWMLGAAIIATEGGYRVWAAVNLRGHIDLADGSDYIESSNCYLAWVSEELTCEQLNSVLESGSISLSPYCEIGPPWVPDKGSCTLTLSGGTVQKKASSTGHVGGVCNGELTGGECGGGVQALLLTKSLEGETSVTTIYSSCEQNCEGPACGADITLQDYQAWANAGVDGEVLEVGCRCGSSVGYQGVPNAEPLSYYRVTEGAWTLIYAAPGCDSPTPPAVDPGVAGEGTYAQGGCG